MWCFFQLISIISAEITFILYKNLGIKQLWILNCPKLCRLYFHIKRVHLSLALFVPNPFRRVDLDRYRRAPSRGPPDARSSSSSSGLHMHQTQSLERSSASASGSASVAGASAASASSSSRSRHGTPSKSQGGGAAQSSMSGSGGGGLAQVIYYTSVDFFTTKFT